VWVSTNGTCSPADTSNSATVVMFSPRIPTGLDRQTVSGPATAISPSSLRRIQGTTLP